MGEISKAMELLGPRGGNLNNPQQHPAWRQSEFNGKVNVAGLPTLHRFDKVESATPGHKNEMPWHRMAAFMLLAGRTNTEIAQSANVGPQVVSDLRAQRWFQELLAVLANETGEDITGLIQAEAAASVEKLVSLRDNSENDRVQLTAAITLLEHAKGKPIQATLNRMSNTKLSPQEEMEQIQQELQALARRKQEILPE